MDEEHLKEIHYKIVEQVNKKHPNYHNVIVPTKDSQKYTNLYSIWEDILFCQYCITNLLELRKEKNSNFIHEFCLWYSLISLYGRCFTQPAHNTKSKLEVRDCFGENDSQLLSRHNKLMDLRHKFLAHRGDTILEQGILFLQIPKDKLKNSPQFHVESVRAGSPLDKELKDYMELFNHLKLVIQRKLEKQSTKIETKMMIDFRNKILELIEEMKL